MQENMQVIREVSFQNEFDLVLNMGSGTIGYLENDAENLKNFDVIANALRPNGKHFMDIMNADYAARHFPCKLWELYVCDSFADFNGTSFCAEKSIQLMVYFKKGANLL